MNDTPNEGPAPGAGATREALPTASPPGTTLDLLNLTWMGSLAVAIAAQQGSFGWVFLFLLPFTLGFGLGLYTPGGAGGCAVPALVVVGVMSLIAFASGDAGFFCIAIMLLYAVVPVTLGLMVGSWRRRVWQRGLGTVAGLFLLTGAGLWLEPRLTPPHGPETVVTARVLPMDRDAAWDAIVFYEDVDAPPPLFARIGLPRPLGTTGVPDRVGARTRCDYSTGSIEKLITELRRGELLSFRVTEQVGVEDRSVELLSGSFSFEDAPGGTRVTLRTTYRPKLQARAAWRPTERAVCHDLHRHVLDGMELQRDRRRGPVE